MIEPRGLHEPRRGRGLVATVAAALLIATGVASGWAVVDSGLFAPSRSGLEGPLAGVGSPVDQPLEVTGAIEITGEAQISQPRDPFRPLITEDSPFFGQPGVGPSLVPSENGVVPPENGFAPEVTVALVEIRTVGGVLRATITVNGETFDVGVGDTFADVYKVVSLTETTAVIMFGDSVFQLSTGQQILK